MQAPIFIMGLKNPETFTMIDFDKERNLAHMFKKISRPSLACSDLLYSTKHLYEGI